MFGSSRKELYQDNADAADLEELSAKLSSDLRQHVRAINISPWLTEEWIELTKSLRYVASIAQMEENLKKNKGPSNQTMWEGDDLACRFVLEEAKLNVLLRMITQYKENSQADTSGALAKAFGASFGVDGKQMITAAERDIGTILRCSFEHVEANQTIDIHCLCAHSSSVLGALIEAAEAGPLHDLTGLQEVGVVYYLESLGRYLEELGEDRVMEIYGDHGLASKLIAALALCHTVYDKDTVVAALRALNSIFDSEHFQSHPEMHLVHDKDKEHLASLGDKFLDVLCKDVKFRMSIRALTDKIKRIQMGK